MITSGKIEQSVECCCSILLKLFERVKRLNSSIFWKTVSREAFPFVYVWWILIEIFENNPFKFVTNKAEKAFQWTRLVELNLVYDPPSPFIKLFCVNKSMF